MKIVIFMTYGVALAAWKADGILERELALYKKHCATGDEVSIVTYGNRSDVEIVRGQSINVLANTLGLPSLLYLFLVPFIHRAHLRKGDIYKTNQMKGAHLAVLCAKIFSKPTVVRQGYSYFEFMRDGSNPRRHLVLLSKWYEAYNLRRATAIIVTTNSMKKAIIERHRISQSIIHVIPNYVAGCVWDSYYQPERIATKRIAGYFGRITEQKNLAMFIEASQGQGIEIELIGKVPGDLSDDLHGIAEGLGVTCRILSRMHQKEIASRMREWLFFVLPSRYEGHPKALIEAMTFGIPVLGADSPGIREVIDHTITGIIASPTIEGFQSGIQTMLNMSVQHRITISQGSRHIAHKQYSLNHIVLKEKVLFNSIIESIH